MALLKSSAATNRRTYMPSGVEQTMSQSMQQSLPAHLKKYVNGENPGYVPEHIQKELTKHMEKKLPSHMKKYAGAYVQQNVVDPSFRKTPSAGSAVPATQPGAAPHPTVNYATREIGTQPSVESAAASTANQASSSPNESLASEQDQAPITPGPAGSLDARYNFIFNDQKSKRRFSLPKINSPIKMALLIVGGGAIFGVLIVTLSSLFGPKLNTKELTEVIGRAQEISRVSDTVSQQSKDINTVNLAGTTSATLSSQQAQLLNYVKIQKKKIVVKELAIYTDKRTDAEIQGAEQGNRLSEYYNSYLKKNLSDYQAAIKTAYDTSSGPNIKAILNNSSISNQTILSTKQLATAQ
jgi:hypothetical protein